MHNIFYTHTPTLLTSANDVNIFDVFYFLYNYLFTFIVLNDEKYYSGGKHPFTSVAIFTSRCLHGRFIILFVSDKNKVQCCLSIARSLLRFCVVVCCLLISLDLKLKRSEDSFGIF